MRRVMVIGELGRVSKYFKCLFKNIGAVVRFEKIQKTALLSTTWILNIMLFLGVPCKGTNRKFSRFRVT